MTGIKIKWKFIIIPVLFGFFSGSSFSINAFVAFSQHVDAVLPHTTDGMKISRDGGSSWTGYVQNKDFYISSLIKLKAGTLFGMNYPPYWVDSTHGTCYYWKSSDDGVTWNSYTGTVIFPLAQSPLSGTWAGFVFWRTMMEMPDGSLQGTMYGSYTGDTKYRCLWVKSTDGGNNWSVVSTIAYDGSISGEGYGEPVVSRCLDSSLLCVMRTGSNLPMYQSRSTDNGLTWSVPVLLPGVNSTNTYSVAPDLYLLSNGVMALSYGRPNCHLLLSLDGNGNNWGNFTATYSSLTSGYTGIRETAPGRLMLIGDKGTDWQSAPSYQIWGKYIDVTKTGNITLGQEFVIENGALSVRQFAHLSVFNNTPAQPQPVNVSDLSNVKGYPNPFSTKTAFGGVFKVINLPANSTVEIFDASERKIITLNKIDPNNNNRIVWDGTDSSGQKVAKGMYKCAVTDSNGNKKYLKVGLIE